MEREVILSAYETIDVDLLWEHSIRELSEMGEFEWESEDHYEVNIVDAEVVPD